VKLRRFVAVNGSKALYDEAVLGCCETGLKHSDCSIGRLMKWPRAIFRRPRLFCELHNNVDTLT
jgi:hypothetical protein